MSEIPTGALVATLVVLIVLSACFSGSETALMSLNRYRLRHLVKSGHGGAVRAGRLLARPDRLIGLILLGNNFVNILASSLATVLALRLLGEPGIAVAAGLLTLIILIFAEVAPKTLAALHPERVAFPAAFVYVPLLKLVYPLVWLINAISNSLLRLLGVSAEVVGSHSLSTEELRTVVAEAGVMIPKRHQRMLLSILDLEHATVEDIMVPRNEIVGIDFTESRDEIIDLLANSQYTRVPVFDGDIDNVRGFLHARHALQAMLRHKKEKEELEEYFHSAYFIPETTPLNKQLLNFQRERRRMGLVIDEYGDVRGLATLDDILEEIVGEFTSDPSTTIRDVHPQADGSYLVDGTANIREINRSMGWELPTSGPKTLSGLIVEYLESIPEAGTTVRLAGYPIEIIRTEDNIVRIARITPALRKIKRAK